MKDNDYNSIVRKVETLAKLSIPQEEHDSFSEQIGKILEFVEKLNELDTKDVEPTSHVMNVLNVFREDKVCESGDKAVYFKRSPHNDGEHFIVPAVIE